MLWFFAFTSIGISLVVVLLLLKQAIRLHWQQWLGGLATMGVLAWLSLDTPPFNLHS